MWKSRASLWCRVPLVLLSVSPLFVGCHPQPSFLAADRVRPTSQARASASGLTVQQSPQYQDAVRRFARHDYPAALAAIHSLLQQPQYQHRPADLDFLRQQQAICRHAIDPPK